MPPRPPTTDVIRGNYFHFNNQKPISEASSRSAAGAACTVRDLPYEKKKICCTEATQTHISDQNRSRSQQVSLKILRGKKIMQY